MRKIEFIVDCLKLNKFNVILNKEGLSKFIRYSKLPLDTSEKLKIVITCNKDEVTKTFQRFKSIIEDCDGVWETYNLTIASKQY